MNAQAAQHIESAHAWQHQIEYDERVLLGEDTLQAARSVVDRLERKAFRTQAFAEQLTQFDVVVDDEHTVHSVSLTRL